MPNIIMTEIFTTFQDYLHSEQNTCEEMRNIVKEIEKSAREILTVLQVIHHENSGSQISTSCLRARQIFEEVRNNYKKLATVVPSGQYYRFNNHWKYVTQRLCFLAALTVFLEVGILVSISTVADILGVSTNSSEAFHLDLEDYLMGILQLCSELARFAVNAVTSGDYERPMQISKFVGDLNAGFRLLNLKNDALRKRFDALKYDVKKIEEVVYDLSIRGLKPSCSKPNTVDVMLISNMLSTLRGKHLHAQARKMAFNVYQWIKSQNEDQSTKEIKEKVSRATGVSIRTIERIIQEGSTSPKDEAESDKRFKSCKKKRKSHVYHDFT
ncbi:hypothetical protein FQA39_LY09547 [Lamprigera yunnana]|nr:hypothetical protein FQA39_LY09547 [Lamprigera yunnana]